MKRYQRPAILTILVLIIAAFFACNLFFFGRKTEDPNELINISELSEDYMENYLNSFSEINRNIDADSTIIVTSTERLENTYGAVHEIEAPNNQYFLYYNSPSEKETAKEKIKNEPGVLYVENDSLFEITDYNSWGIEAMGLDQAISDYSVQGSAPVTVAIIDTGCDMELFNQSYEGKIQETYNLYDNRMHDGHGHGTHIAGTIAEGTPDNVKILPVKIANSAQMSMTTIVTAINYITYYHKADVINMSFGRVAEEDDTAYSQYVAIQAAMNNNIISVAAAGNESSSNVGYPASFDNTITVSAVDPNKQLAEFSNFGPDITFTAPGVDIVSINGTKSGTSMATPHVVSAIAILKGTNKSLSKEQAVEILKHATIDLGDPGRDDQYGYGLIDMSNYLNIKSMTEDTSFVDFEVTNTSAINASFGNISNLMDIGVQLIDEANNRYDRFLGDLEGLEITGYDAFLAGDQEITLTYKGISKNVIVNNGSSGGNDYAYFVQRLNSEEATILEISHAPRKLYIPEYINGYKIVALGDNSSTKNIFVGKDNSEHIILPGSVREIRNRAFQGKENLKSVKGGAEFVSVGKYAFDKAYRLAEFEPTLSEIDDAAFRSNHSLKSITLSDDLDYIPNHAFSGCTSLESINMPSNLEDIGSYALSNTNIKNLNIPAGLTSIDETSFRNMPNLETITVDPENPVYDSRDNSNALILTAENKIILGSGSTIIPSSVVAINSNAFLGNQKIQEIHTNNVERIQESAFAGCVNLKKFYIENDNIIENWSDFTFYNSALDYERLPNLMVFAEIESNEVDTLNIKNSLLSQGVRAFIITTSLKITASADQEYKAFQKASNISVTASYSGYADLSHTLSEEITNYTVEYQNGDSFKAGDTSFRVSGITQYGDIFKVSIAVSVAKATPTYEVPTNLTAKLGEKLSDIELTGGFEWMNGDQTITELGEQTFKARFVPTDADNYETIDNIDITLVAESGKTVVQPEITVANKTYDGLDTISSDLITVSGLESSEYTIISATSLYTNVGTSTASVKLKLTDDKFKDFAFEGNQQEHTFTVQFNIVPKKIAKPTKPDGYYNFNSNEITFYVSGYDEETMTISNNKGTNAGTYDTTISLKNANYIWDDNTTEDVVLQYEIKKANLSVTDNSSDRTIIFDNSSHTISISLEYPSGTTLRYKDANGEYTLSQIPEYTEPGEYITAYKLYLDDNHTEYYGEHKLTILANFIIDLDEDVNIKDDNLIVNLEDRFSVVAGKIHTTPSDNTIEHHDKDGNLVDSDVMKTGDKVKITVEGHDQEYVISVQSDTDGNGLIEEADYLSIRNDIMGIAKLSGAFKRAADMNNNNEVDIIDYIRIKKKVMGVNS
ncbi:leucine-rich repeat protein [Candidatus Saccharibacteria bacterium]|nr:leucine-rich repeat protein [Candidatus Saccharibacteria bacterium]